MDRYCPVCGAHCAPDERFCQNCGTKLPEIAPAAPAYEASAQPAPAFVPASQQMEAAPAYVPASQQTEAAPAYVPASRQAEAAPALQAEPVYQPPVNYAPQQNLPDQATYGAPTYAAPAYGTPSPAAKPEKKKIGLIIGLCACAAVLIAAAIVLYFFVFTPNSVTLSEEAIAVDCEDSFDLKAEISPGSAILSNDVTWTSSNENIATVDDKGRVTAVKSGVCTITATTGNGKTASCVVTVPMGPHALYLSDTSIHLEVGESYPLDAEVYPAGASSKITWTSGNESIAGVDAAGNVTARNSGTCTVTATASNGVTASCSVTVGVEPTSILLSSYSVSLGVGEKLTLKADVYPEGATNYTITWSSNNTSVATVSNGKVTGVSEGSCKITAALPNGISESCTVTVTPKSEQVTSITLSRYQLDLTVGDNYTLTATILPERASNTDIKWTSSDSSVATVNGSGKVSAVGKGTCRITATAHNGVSDYCAVTVAEKTVEVESVKLSDSQISLKVGDNYTLAATVSPKDATDPSLKWSSSNTSVATVNSSGKVTAVGEGTCKITAASSNGLSASCAVTVTKAQSTASSAYDKYILGDWRLTLIYDWDTEIDSPASDYGVTGKITFYSDHTARLTIGNEYFDVSWGFNKLTEYNNYDFWLDFNDGDDLYYFDYIVDNKEIWLYYEALGYTLTFEK